MKLSDVVIYLKFCGIQLIFVFPQYVEEPKGWYFCKSCAWNDNHTIQGTAWENISWPKFSRISSPFSVSCEMPFVNIFFIAFCTFIYNIYCASRIGVVRDIRFFLRAIVDFLYMFFKITLSRKYPFTVITLVFIFLIVDTMSMAGEVSLCSKKLLTINTYLIFFIIMSFFVVIKWPLILNSMLVLGHFLQIFILLICFLFNDKLAWWAHSDLN